jgi:hypothetical protein
MLGLGLTSTDNRAWADMRRLPTTVSLSRYDLLIERTALRLSNLQTLGLLGLGTVAV